MLFHCLKYQNLFGKICSHSSIDISRSIYSCYMSSYLIDQELIRNVAIIAHVDHGKTTLVDCLLRSSGKLPLGLSERRVMDSNVLEKERGITILSKYTSMMWDKYRIYIVDTPGHADFGGEVERVLSMVDGVLLIVDSTEGPMAQTKFVLGKALKRGLRPIVIQNKIDRQTSRPDQVDSDILDLFLSLEANEEQLNYPTLYASAKEGWASLTLKQNHHHALGSNNMDPIFQTIIEHIPSPKVHRDKPFSMLVSSIESNSFLGKCYVGKIESGLAKVGDSVIALARDGKIMSDPSISNRITKLFVRHGLDQQSVNEAGAGDIITLSGLFISLPIYSTICSPMIKEPIKALNLDPPTISIMFSVNDSPLANMDGKSVTLQYLIERIDKDVQTNPALSYNIVTEGRGGCQVFGRGELQLGILIEMMRREGLEFTISQPRVLQKPNPSNPSIMEEPIEEVSVDVDEDYCSVVIEKITGNRKGLLLKVAATNDGKSRLIFNVPTRGLIGYQSELGNDTRGTGILARSFSHYGPYVDKIEGSRTKGSLISMTDGLATGYALSELASRGILFVSPGMSVYSGMIIGESSRPGNMHVNPTRQKIVSNIRTVMKDEFFRLSPPKTMSLEEHIAYIAEDELLEITPHHIRLLKRPEISDKRGTRNK